MRFNENAIQKMPKPVEEVDTPANEPVFDKVQKEKNLDKENSVECLKKIGEYLDIALEQHKDVPANQLESIKDWLEIDHSPEINEKIEDIIIKKIKKAGEITSQTFLLLNNLFNGKFYNYQHLQYFISHDENINRTAIKQLMYHPSDKNSQINTLKLLDVLKNFITQAKINRISINDRGKSQDDLIDEYRLVESSYDEVDLEEYIKTNFKSFQTELFFYLEEKKETFDNYLIQQNIEDLLSSYFYDYEYENIYNQYHDYLKKENIEEIDDGSYDLNDTISGDESLYIQKKFEKSYKNRNILGINKGNIFENPVLQISPDYYGYYSNGKIDEVFFYHENMSDIDSFNNATKKFAEENPPEIEDIYNIINKHKNAHIDSDDNYSYFNDHLNDFLDRPTSKGKEFFIDLSKIDEIEKVHPFVVNIILKHNDKFLQKKNLPCNAQQLSQEEFVQKVFPYSQNKQDQNDEMAPYLTLAQLHMRQKVQMDFGIELSNYDFALQRNFLKFLNTRSVDNVKELQKFLSNSFDDQDKKNRIKSFLSCEFDIENGEKILNIGKNLSSEPEITKKIFSKIAELVEVSESKAEELKKDFYIKDVESEIDLVRIGFLRKADKIIGEFDKNLSYNKNDNMIAMEALIRELENIKMENIMLLERYKILKKEGTVQNIKELDDISTEEYKAEEIISSNNILQQFEQLYRKNYKNYSEEGLKSLLNQLQSNLNKENAKVFTIERNKEIISFIVAVEKSETKEVYLCALNIDSALKETASGRIIFEDTLNYYLDSGWKIKVEASPDNALNYINQYNFFGYKRLEDQDEDYILELARDDSVKFASKDKNIFTRKKIIEMTNGQENIENKIAVWLSNKKTETPPQIDDGYVITQMFKGSKEEKKGYYFLMEKNSY